MSELTTETAPMVTFASERSEGEFTDAELTVLALAADPDQVPDADAVPLVDDTSGLYGPLPSWYMPPVRVTRRTPLRTGIIVFIIASFLLIEALGLCVTYGQLVAA
jgi:hypothetical protein